MTLSRKEGDKSFICIEYFEMLAFSLLMTILLVQQRGSLCLVQCPLRFGLLPATHDNSIYDFVQHLDERQSKNVMRYIQAIHQYVHPPPHQSLPPPHTLGSLTLFFFLITLVCYSGSTTLNLIAPTFDIQEG